MKAKLDGAAMKIAYAADPYGYQPVQLVTIKTGASHDYLSALLQHVVIGNGKIAGTDGFILAERPITTKPESGETILVSAKDILRAWEWGAKELTIETRKHGQATIKGQSHDTEFTIETQLLEAEYPKYANLFPTTERKAYVALSIDMLSRMLKIASENDSPAIKLKIREPTEAIEFSCCNTKGLVMPCSEPE